MFYRSASDYLIAVARLDFECIVGGIALRHAAIVDYDFSAVWNLDTNHAIALAVHNKAFDDFSAFELHRERNFAPAAPRFSTVMVSM